MAGQYLLEQSRSGERQAQDKDGVGRWVSRTGMAREQPRAAGFLLLFQFAAHRIGAVARLRALQIIALSIMTKAPFVILAVLMRFAQRKREVNSVHDGFRSLPPCRGNIMVLIARLSQPINAMFPALSARFKI